MNVPDAEDQVTHTNRRDTFHPQGWREVPKGSANANQTGCPDSTGLAEGAALSGAVRGVMAPDLQPAQV